MVIVIADVKGTGRPTGVIVIWWLSKIAGKRFGEILCSSLCSAALAKEPGSWKLLLGFIFFRSAWDTGTRTLRARASRLTDLT